MKAMIRKIKINNYKIIELIPDLIISEESCPTPSLKQSVAEQLKQVQNRKKKITNLKCNFPGATVENMVII